MSYTRRVADEDPDVTQVAAAIADLYPRSILTGFVIVAEWVDPDGTRDLSRHHSENAESWELEGWLSHGLEWSGGGDDDDGN